MATRTSSWHSLHLGMMSTFDILRPCPKIIISPLNSIASCCSPWLWISCTTHLLSNLHLTFISLSPFLSLAFHSSIRLSFYSLFLFIPPFHQAILCFFICTLWISLSSIQSALHAHLGWIRPLQLQPQFWYHLSAFHSLFLPFLFFSTHLSVYTSALSPVCQLTLAIDSIKCSCIPSLAAFLFLFRKEIQPQLVFPPSSFHSLYTVRQSHGVNSSFIRSLWNLWCWRDELDWRLLHLVQSEFWERQRLCLR